MTGFRLQISLRVPAALILGLMALGCAGPAPDAVFLAPFTAEHQETVQGAWELYNDGERADALFKIERLARNNPNCLECQQTAAAFFHSSLDLDRAVMHYERTLALDPKRIEARLGLAILYSQLGLYRHTLEQADRTLELEPGNVRALTLRGVALRGVGDGAGAEQAFKRASEIDPADPAPFDNLGDLYAALGRHQVALIAYEEARLRAAPSAGLQVRIAGVHERSGDMNEALAAYQAALGIEPENTAALLGLARVYGRHLEDYARAFVYAQRAAAVEPGHPEILNMLGWTLHMQGENRAALPIFERARLANPANPDILYNYGQVFEALGNQAAADRLYDQALHYLAVSGGLRALREALDEEHFPEPPEPEFRQE